MTLPFPSQRSTLAFRRFAWGVLFYNILVVVWGAFVRASKSGDGCGAHWPTCHGEILPVFTEFKRVVEFSHRVSSGLVLILVIALLIWATRLFPKGHPVRYGARLTLLFTICEALIGAGLVLYKLVAGDTSMYRAVSLCGHLTITLGLLGSVALTAHWANGHPMPQFKGKLGSLMAGALAGTVALAVTGALSALGDTLYPASSLIAGIQHDFAHDAAFIIKQRPLHPLAATIMLVVVWLLTKRVSREQPQLARRSAFVFALYAGQYVLGLVNLGMLAPIGMQMLHLGVAVALWSVLILWMACALQPAKAEASALEGDFESNLEGDVASEPRASDKSSEVTWPNPTPSQA